MSLEVIGDGIADTLGMDGVHDDPVWRCRVHLTGLEQDLLRSWWVRRLAFIAHAGAAAVTSTQSYSRLEHSLGLLTLVDSLAPGDELARAAALVHDVGHLPLSHTFEGVAGLDHHQIGRDRIRQLGPVFAARSVDVDQVIDIAEGSTSSALHGPTEALRLDHLESWVRSGHAHGRTREPPAITLAKLRLHDGAVDTDPATAAYLVELALGEARWRTSTPNVVATGLVRQLSATVLNGLNADRQRRVASMTDQEFWALLLADFRTGLTTRALQHDPGAWAATALDLTAGRGGGSARPGSTDAFKYDVGQLYLDLPASRRADSDRPGSPRGGSRPAPPAPHHADETIIDPLTETNAVTAARGTQRPDHGASPRPQTNPGAEDFEARSLLPGTDCPR